MNKNATEKMKSSENRHLKIVTDTASAKIQYPRTPQVSFFEKLKSSFQFRGLRGRMLSIGLIPVLLIICVSVFVDFNIRRISARLNSVVVQLVPALITGKGLIGEMTTIKSQLWMAVGYETDPGLSAEFAQNAEDAVERFEKVAAHYNALTLPPQAIELRTETMKGWAQALPKIKKSVDLLRERSTDYRKFLFDDLKPALETFEMALTNLEKYNVEVVESERTKADQLALATRVSSAASAGGVLLIGLILSLWITARTVRKLSEVSQALTQEAKSSVLASNEMASVMSTLSMASTSTAHSIEETTSSLEELNSMVKSTSTNAVDATRFTESAVSEARQGEQEIEKLIVSISEIADNSKKVEEIVSVIDDIAFQTNLLALNAAVESARAGEHGRGFAVVADSVRSLAQKSTQSAKEISDMIRSNSERMKQGTSQADRSVEYFKRIVQSIAQISQINTEISAATENQSQGINGINTAMYNLNGDSQKNMMATERISETLEQIKQQSERLEETVHELDKVIGG